MVDVNIEILNEADTVDLLSLEEARLALGTVSTAVTDPQLAGMITQSSDAIATLCNRVFAKEEVQETWRWEGCLCLNNPRIFLSHWPVDKDDIEAVESPSGTPLDPSAWVIEKRSGKLSNFNGWQEPTVITYTGGYDLPDEAPPALKQACGLLIRTAYFQLLRASTTGIRSISHRESRVMYFDPNILAKQGAGTLSAVEQALQNLLAHYIRFAV